MGIVIDYDTIPPPGCDAGPAPCQKKTAARPASQKKNAALKAASFRCGGARGNLAAWNKDLNNLAGICSGKLGWWAERDSNSRPTD